MLVTLGAAAIWGLWYFSKNKLLSYCEILYLAMISAFNSMCADRSGYLTLYSNIEKLDYLSDWEVGYTILQKIFAHFGISFYMYLFIIFALCYWAMYQLVEKRTKQGMYFLLLYSFFPFFISSIQIRYMLATTFLFLGVMQLRDVKVKSIILYLLAFGLAVSMHYSSAFAVIFLLVWIIRDKRVQLVYWIAVLVFIYVFYKGTIVNVLVGYFSSWSKLISWTKGRTHYLPYLVVIVNIVWTTLFKYYEVCLSVDDVQKKDFQFFYQINLVALCIFPFIFIDGNFTRLYRIYALINYVGLLQRWKLKSINKYNKILETCMFAIGIGILMYLDDRNNVIHQILAYNYIFHPEMK